MRAAPADRIASALRALLRGCPPRQALGDAADPLRGWLERVGRVGDRVERLAQSRDFVSELLAGGKRVFEAPADVGNGQHSGAQLSAVRHKVVSRRQAPGERFDRSGERSETLLDALYERYGARPRWEKFAERDDALDERREGVDESGLDVED